MAIARLMTADEVVTAMIELIQAGRPSAAQRRTAEYGASAGSPGT